MISVIIPNYNTKELLGKCLDSLRSQTYRQIEIIVVDNASCDGSIEMLESLYPEVKLVKNTTNLLFCKAENQGIEASKGDFILCLNTDCVLDKDYLTEALRSIDKDAKIGMVSGKILREDKKTIDSTGQFLGRSRKAIERGYEKKDRGQYETPGYIFGVPGACAFFRKSMLNDIRDEFGYFDERFGMYYEDLDLCWRAQKRRWKAYYTPKAIAYHGRAGSALTLHRDKKRFIFPYLSGDLKKRYIMNRYRCMKKNDSFWSILINLPFIIGYDSLLWGYMLFSALSYDKKA